MTTNVFTQTKYINETTLECPVPSSSIVRLTNVMLTADETSLCNDGGPLLRYLEAPIITSITPTIVHSGSIITVVGQHLNNNLDLSINIGHLRISSFNLIRLNKNTFHFVAPEHPTGPVLVSVSYNGIGDIDSSLNNSKIIQYTHHPIINSITPNISISSLGGTILTIHGQNFVEPIYGRILCRFTPVAANAVAASTAGTVGTVGTAGTAGTAGTVFTHPTLFTSVPKILTGNYINSNQVSCVTPSKWNGGIYKIEISFNDGYDYTSNELTIAYNGRTIIHAITPSSGPDIGGTTIHIRGENFTAFEENDIFCLFESSDPSLKTKTKTKTKTAAKIISNTKIQCVTPSIVMDIGSDVNFTSVALHLVNKDSTSYGNNYGFNEMMYQYYKTPVVTNVSPSTFPSGSENEITLQIQGLHFIRSNNITCHLNNDIVIAGRFVRDTLIECIDLPASIKLGVLNIGLSLNGGHDVTNGKEKKFSSVVVTSQPEVLSLTPNSGRKYGSTKVLVLGRGFITATTDSSSTPFCRFGAIEVPALILNATAMECITPAVESAAVIASGSGETVVNVEIIFRLINTKQKLVLNTPNGIQLTYTYREETSITSFSPTRCTSRGGCLIDIYGNGFVDSIETHVRIQMIEQKGTTNKTTNRTRSLGTVLSTTQQVQATVVSIVSNTHMKIQVPENPLGINIASLVTMSVSVNAGVEYSKDGPSFEYVSDILVLSVFPSYLPEFGNVPIKITGQHFVEPYETGQYKCAFHGQSDVVVDAKWRSDTELSCLSPPSKSLGASTVEIIVNGNTNQKTNQLLNIYYFRTKSVQAITPMIGSETGGTVVTVQGTHFDEDAKLICIFGQVESKDIAIVLNTTHILCTSPHVSLDSMLPSSGVVRLRVFSSYVVEAYGGVTEELLQLGDSLDLHDSNQNLLHFTYVASPVLLSITPKIGFLSSSTSTIKIMGRGLPDPNQQGTTNVALRGALACQFRISNYENVTIYGTLSFVRSTLILCHVPDGKTIQNIIMTQNQNQNEMFAIESSLHVTIDLILHRSIISTNAMHYVMYAQTPNVTSLSPSLGPISGGSWIRINGNSFIHSNHIFCKFGDSKPIQGRFLTTTSLLCQTPPALNVDDSVAVEISMNGVSYTSNNVLFKYVSGAVIVSALPSSGPSNGGTKMSIYVENIPSINDQADKINGDDESDEKESNNNMYCRFSSSTDDSYFLNSEFTYLTAVTVVNRTTIYCITPPIESNQLIASSGTSITVDLVIINQGMEPERLSVNSFLYLYYGQPTLLSVLPVSAPLMGGSTITLRGQGFSVLGSLENDNDVLCIFESFESPSQTQTSESSLSSSSSSSSSLSSIVSVPAIMVSSDVIQCITPVWVKEEITIVYISLNGVVPTTSEENVKSTNSNSALQFYFYRHPQLSSMTPDRGMFSRSNDVQVSILGSTLFLPLNASNLICNFGVPETNNVSLKTVGYVANVANVASTSSLTSSNRLEHTNIMCPTPVLKQVPMNEIQQVTISTSAPSVEKQCFEARKVSPDADEVQVVTIAATGQLYEVQEIVTSTSTNGPEIQMIETLISDDTVDEIQTV